MHVRRWLLAVLLLMLLSVPRHGEPRPITRFVWVGASDIRGLDPYLLNQSVQLSLVSNIYEPLVRRGRNFELQPGLASRWSQPKPLVWRFHLREGARWQDGTPFTAEDVVFSWHRVLAKSSGMSGSVAAITAVKAVGENTVEITTHDLDPILPQELTEFLIMSKAWCEKYHATEPADIAAFRSNYAVDHAMGTGPFKVMRRQPGKTVLIPNPDWWDKPEHNLDEAEFDVIADPAARIAAFTRSDEVDLLEDVPPDSVPALRQLPSAQLLQKPELRTIFVGMDQSRPDLPGGGRNPFLDRRVREAFALAIDEQEIAESILHGLAHPTWLLWGPGVSGYDPAQDHHPAPDLDRARQDLAAAGFAGGFNVAMDCPNGRYANDAEICKSIARMLAAIGVTISVPQETQLVWLRHVGSPLYDASLYLIGWTPDTQDAFQVLDAFAGSRGGDAPLGRGEWNTGGYSNGRVDALLEHIRSETVPAARQTELNNATQILQHDVAYIPLHQQTLIWAVRNDVKLEQSPDAHLALRYVRKGAG
jgi:peptide/nickel transport system substrate-binding protein